MPSFDVVSEVDKHELTNAVDQSALTLKAPMLSLNSTASLSPKLQAVRFSSSKCSISCVPG